MTPRDATPVPANVPGIYWRPLDANTGDDPADPSKVVLATAAAPTTPLPFTTTALADGALLIVPTNPLAENTTYVVTDGNTCESSGYAGPTTTFQVGATAELPTALGSLSVVSDTVEMITVGTSSGSCSTSILGHRVGITPNLIAEATPWTSVFHFETYVDDQLWRRTESINIQASPRGTWELYRTCESTDTGASPGLAAGPHTVKVKATIPGTTTVLWSEPITVDMHCPGEPGAPDDPNGGGCNAGGTTGSLWLALVALGLVVNAGRKARRTRCHSRSQRQARR
jgi:hypothetical protein